MLQSQLFGKTLKEIPEEVQIPSHQLLVRAGFIRQTAAGLYSYLPLGFRVLEKVKKIIYAELARVGVQHLLMPVLHPAELWQESGRWSELDEIMYKFKNHQDRDLCLAVTHEETISDLVRREVASYRQLPLILNHIQLKFRDELRPRGGLLRLREFWMQDAYSFDKDEHGLQKSYEKVSQAYREIFKQCGLETIVVEADSGKMGGKFSHEFMILAPSGEDSVITCNQCDYKANREKAEFVREDKNSAEKQQKQREVTVPALRGLSVQTQSLYHQVEPWCILKTLIYIGDEKDFFAVVLRGDLEVNETKVKNLVPFATIRLVSDEELALLGTVKGFVSPLGLSTKVKLILGDVSLSTVHNFITSPNKKDTDVLGVNYARDFTVSKLVDVASAEAGHTCNQCQKGKLQETRGVEVAHTFKLGTRYSKPMGLQFTDEAGKEQLILMGCYGIGVDRIVAGAVEQRHDEHGIIWPESIAPFQVHLVLLDLDNQEIRERAFDLYEKLRQKNIEVLLDDRDEKAGVKFKDADLIGIPWRVVISKRSWEKGGVEIKKRDDAQAAVVSIEQLIQQFE